MNYEEAIQFLYGLQLFGTKLGLENTRKLARLAGNPQEKLRFIHVAGTNGKGSTCAMLESIYRHAGLRVGLYTSPHMVSFGERIQVNRVPIPPADVVRLVREINPLLAQFPEQEHPTFFEVVTIMALRYFAEQNCDLVIWETGLGGRLDATNIVTPLVSVITNIQFDHQTWLGETLEKIAREKAGIIKLRVPVVTAVDNRDALRVIYEAASYHESPFWLITWTQAEFRPLNNLELPLLGEHQRLNAAVAVYAVRAAVKQIPVSDEIIREGLRKVVWPGRLQLVTRADGVKLLLDGAHNIGGAEALRSAWKKYFQNETATLILGILGEKDCGKICDILAPLAAKIIIVPVNSARTADPAILAAACRAANGTADVRQSPSLAAALNETSGTAFTVVAGSLYLIGEAMELLGLARTAPTHIARDEKKLNDWAARKAGGGAANDDKPKS